MSVPKNSNTHCINSGTSMTAPFVISVNTLRVRG